MKKSSFVAMVLGTAGGMLFALGMCMALIEEWGAFGPGVVLGVVGVLLLMVTLVVFRRMEHKAPLHLSGKAVLTALVAIVGALGLGVGMCFVTVWEQMVTGIVVGMLGIVALLCLIPLTKGIKQ